MGSNIKYLVTFLFGFLFPLRVAPSLQEFKSYVVSKTNEPEVTWQPLYDNVLYPTAGINQLVYFQNFIGQGITSAIGAVVGSPKTIADTNMQAAGQLPAPQGFTIESIETIFRPGNSAVANTFTLAVPSVAAAAAAASATIQLDDVLTIAESGVFDLFIMSKTYLYESPLGRMPCQTYVGIDTALASGDTTTHNEVGTVIGRAMGPLYSLPVPISLEANTNFKVTLSWPAPVATPSGKNGRLGVYLNGYLFRNAQ